MNQLRRIETIKKDNKLNNKDLAALWGVSEETVKNYWRPEMKRTIPKVYLEKLADKYDVNKEWLISGKGENIYLSDAVEIDARKTLIGTHTPEYKYAEKIDLKAAKADLIPFYDVQVMASSIEVFSDQTTTPTFNMSIPGFSDCDFAVNVYGHSMYPTFESGTIVICKRILNKDLIMYGECYFIVTNEYRMVKRLLKCNRTGWVTASSDNHNGHNSPDGKTYGSQDIALKDILFLYLVKGSIKRHQV